MALEVASPTLGRSASVPGLMKLGTSMTRGDRHHRKTTLGNDRDCALPLGPGAPISVESQELLQLLRTPSWRLQATEPVPTKFDPGDLVSKNMVHPRVAPAWLKHDGQVLRWYAFFQEHVNERADENCRYRQVEILYFMEDGTIRIDEPKQQNSGIPQGSFLKRHRVLRDDGFAFIVPDDFQISQDITIYKRTYHVSGCDRFTRWFYSENGLELPDDEPPVEDLRTKTYQFEQLAIKGLLPKSKQAVEAKNLAKFQVGQPPADKKFIQFLLNDRKVLRFKAYWDDTTLYGARTYFVIHFYLADNSVEINEAHCRNSGKDKYPVFMKRAKLNKHNYANPVPGALLPDPAEYGPRDFIVGESINVWRRKFVIYDCDDFTRDFYKEYLGIDQAKNRLDVSNNAPQHLKLNPPPHNGLGSEEDSLMSCVMIQPKAAKQDLVRLMTLAGEVLRFEARMINAQPEDESRRFLVSTYPADDHVAVFEVPQRNSGHNGGKFAEKKRMKNPDTGKYFTPSDFFVGQTVRIASQPFLLVRADEHCLQYLEAHPQMFPHADPVAIAIKLAPLVGHPEVEGGGVDPDRLKDIAQEAGVSLSDHEIITLLRRFTVDGVSATPFVNGPEVLDFTRSVVGNVDMAR